MKTENSNVKVSDTSHTVISNQTIQMSIDAASIQQAQRTLVTQ